MQTTKTTQKNIDNNMTLCECFNMNEILNIEQLGNENVRRFWWAHELSVFLGYKSYDSFANVVKRAIQDAINLNVDWQTEFEGAKQGNLSTYKLSRFAVMLCVMQADNKKPEVAQARAQLASIAEQLFYEVERLQEREKLSSNEKNMVDVAVRHGLPNEGDAISRFRNKGYIGLYNMGLKELKNYKGASEIKETLYDYMNPIEIAANNFRVVMTAEKIKSEKLTGEQKIMNAAQTVGREVRDMVIKNTGQEPENIPFKFHKIA